jgi:hypothetical protein
MFLAFHSFIVTTCERAPGFGKQVYSMWMKWMRAVGAVLLGLLAGCGKDSNSAESAKPVAAQNQKASGSSNLGETIARIHWLGMKQLAGETNATNFMAIWNLPESQKLEAQTLDKLATAPWRLLLHQPSTNASMPMAASPLLRPLLDDLVNAESYLEITQETNKPGQFALVIRLDPARASLWQTNLSAVLESLTGVKPTSGSTSVGGNQPGFSVKKHHEPNLIELVRSGDWTVLGLAQDSNRLMRDMAARIERNKNPFEDRTTNFWIEAEVDSARVAQSLPRLFHLPENIAGHVPRITLSVVGDGQNIHSRGEFDFPRPLGIKLEPWIIPTNLINDPLISFSAFRGLKGIGPLTRTLDPYQIEDQPNQLYIWAINGNPFQTEFAVPAPNQKDIIPTISKKLIPKANPWLAINGLGRLEESPGTDSLTWNGLFLIKPFLRLDAPSGFVVAGLTPLGTTNQPVPAALLDQVLVNTNLCFYDWELTGPRVEDWVYMGQLLRFGLHKAQMPAESAAIRWLRALETKLGNSVTEISVAKADELILVRKSAVGLSAIEIHLVADWFESPFFPLGIHSLLSEKMPNVK